VYVTLGESPRDIPGGLKALLELKPSTE